MKKSYYYFTIAIVLLSHTVIAQILPVKNGDLYSYTFNNIYFEVTAAEGGKVTSLTIDGDEMIYNPAVKPTGYEDYGWGGTVWIAPESAHPWPDRHPVIDQGVYTAEIEGNKLILTSGIGGDKLGNEFILVKEFYIDETDNSIVSKYTLTNKGDAAITKSIWELTRIQQQGISFWAKGKEAPKGKGTIPDISDEVTESNNHYWIAFDNTISGYGKFYSDVGEGWLAHADNNNHLFIKSFEKISNDDVVSGDTVLEYWLDENDYFFEFENVSRGHTINSEESFSYEVKWYLTDIPENTDTSLGSLELVDLVRSIVPQDVLSTKNITQVNTISIYPNPTSTVLNINTHNNTDSKITIYNLAGRKVLSKEFTDNTSIDVSRLARGIYFYQLKSGDTSLNKKLIIK